MENKRKSSHISSDDHCFQFYSLFILGLNNTPYVYIYSCGIFSCGLGQLLHSCYCQRHTAPALYTDDGDGTNPGPASAARVPPAVADAAADAAVGDGCAGGRSDDGLCPARLMTRGSQPPATWSSRPTSPRPASDRHSLRCPSRFL